MPTLKGKNRGTAQEVDSEVYAAEVARDREVAEAAESAAPETPASDVDTATDNPSNLPATSTCEAGELAEISDEEYDDWLEEDDDEGGSIPILKIEQKDRDTQGLLVCKDMDEYYDNLKVVILKAQPGCILWPEKFSADSEPLCKSDDGINPTPIEGSVPFCEKPEACRKVWKKVDGKNVSTKPCVYGNWDNGEKPRCAEIMKLLVMEVGDETMVPYWFPIKGYGMTEYHKLNRKLAMKVKALKGHLARQGKNGAKKCLFSFTLGTELKEHDSGDHYIPSFTEIELTPVDLHRDILAFGFQAQEMNLATQHEGGEGEVGE